LLTVLGVAGIAHTATLEEEQQRLADLQRQIRQLQAVNTDIDSNLAALEEREAGIKPDTEAERELVAARRAVTSAEEQLAASPGPENQDVLDNSRFKLKLAERRFQKANEEPLRLRRERSELGEAKASNERRINYLNARVSDQQQLIASLQKEQQVASERSRAQQEELLRQEQQRRQQAQDEIERLKALLAAKEAEEAAALQRQEEEALARDIAAAEAAAAREEAASAPADAVEPAAPATAAAAPTPVSTPPIELISDRARAAELAARAARAAGQGNRLNKILHYKSYSGSELVERSSHSLQNLDNTLYRCEVTLRNGKSEFVVGGDSWPLEIPPTAAGSTHVVLLDLTAADQPRLWLFAANLVP